MNIDPQLSERLRRETGEASRRQALVEADIDRRHDRPPEPGDLFVLKETADHPVEWAIVERDPADTRRLRAVPADLNPLLGSADVEADPAPGDGSGDAARGPLSLRCAHAVWLDADALDGDLRTGVLEPGAVARARRRCSDLDRGIATGSVLEREVDDEAEYSDWARMLADAREAAPERPAEAPPGNVVPLRRPLRPPPSRRSYPLAAAASVLLLLSAGLGYRLWTSAREHRAVVAEQRGELERLEQERQRLEADHRRDLARLRDEQREQELEHQRRLADLEASAQPTARVNLPLILLAAGQVRAGAQSVEVAPDAEALMLIVQVDDRRAFDAYRLELREQPGGRRVWSDSRLVPSRLSELTALLPRGLVPDGRYALRLFGLRGGEAEPLLEQVLTLATRSGG